MSLKNRVVAEWVDVTRFVFGKTQARYVAVVEGERIFAPQKGLMSMLGAECAPSDTR